MHTEAQQRDYSKFFTPFDLSMQMAMMIDAKPGETYIDPHAGDGALVRAMLTIHPYINMDACELQKKYMDILFSIANNTGIGDFLSMPFKESYYDGIIANPPFGNEIDLSAHFRLMKYIVKPDGCIVSIVPDDFTPPFLHQMFPINNWATNSDGTITTIKLIKFFNHK